MDRFWGAKMEHHPSFEGVILEPKSLPKSTQKPNHVLGRVLGRPFRQKSPKLTILGAFGGHLGAKKPPKIDAKITPHFWRRFRTTGWGRGGEVGVSGGAPKASFRALELT